MACHLFVAKPLPEPMLDLLSIRPWKTYIIEILIKIVKKKSFKKLHLKCCLQNFTHFVQVSMC